MSRTEQQASGIERTDLHQHDLIIPGRMVAALTELLAPYREGGGGLR